MILSINQSLSPIKEYLIAIFCYHAGWKLDIHVDDLSAIMNYVQIAIYDGVNLTS